MWEEKNKTKPGLLNSVVCAPLKSSSDAVTHSHVVLSVHFDGLVSLCGDQSALRVVEHAGEDARLAVQGTGLHSRVDALEVVSGPPIPQVDGSVVGYDGELKTGVIEAQTSTAELRWLFMNTSGH